MKRIIIMLAVLTLVAGSACAEKQTVGKGLDKLGSSKIPSKSPTPTKAPSKKPTKAPPKTVKPVAGYKGRTYAFTIRSSANGYEPREKVVYAGDTITFENLDPNQKHTFTADNGAWDSKELSAGDKPFTYKVTLAPGDYTFHCELVPYVLGGPLRVLATPK